MLFDGVDAQARGGHDVVGLGKDIYKTPGDITRLACPPGVDERLAAAGLSGIVADVGPRSGKEERRRLTDFREELIDQTGDKGDLLLHRTALRPVS